MSLRTCLGPRRPLLTEDPTRRACSSSDVLPLPRRPSTRCSTRRASPFAPRPARRDVRRSPTGPAGSRDGARPRSPTRRRRPCAAGVELLVISDAGRRSRTARRSRRCSRPAPCTTGSSRSRRRQDASIVVDTGDARDVHAVACLLGYGADAICPRLALATVAALADDGQLGELARGRRRRRSSRPRSRTACSRSSRRWGSRPSTATAPRRSSRCSGSAPEVVDDVPAAARRRPSAGSASTRSAPTCSRATRPRSPTTSRRSTSRARPVPQARRRVPRQQPRGVRGAARVDRAQSSTTDADGTTRHAPPGRARSAARRDDGAKFDDGARSAPAEDQGQVIFLDGPRRGPSRCPPADPRRHARRAPAASARSARAAPSSTTRFRELVERRPPTELHDLLELVPGGHAGAARRGRAGERDHAPVLDRRDAPRLAVGRGARDARDRDEPDRRQEQLRRGRRGPGPLPHPRHRPRPELADQADRVGPLRRDARVLRVRRRAQHQDGAGLEAGRGRPAARAQGERRRSRGCGTPSPASASSRRRRTTTSTRSRISRSSSTT